MEDLGFRQSDAEPCLLILSTITLLCYCDDCLLLYKDPAAAVNILTKEMKDTGIILKEESDVAGYLDVFIDRDADNDTICTITLRQSSLAQRIFEALYLDDDAS